MVFSLIFAFVFSGPVSALAMQERAIDAQAKPEEAAEVPSVAVASAPEAPAAPAAEPLALISNSPRCLEAANSPLAEPEWFADECLGGVRPESPATGPEPSARVPGDLFYLHNIRGAGTPPFSVYTAPIPTYNFTTLGPNNLPIFAMDFDAAATTLWGINNTTRGLGTYDLTTGAFTQTAVTMGIPAAETISGLKFDPTSSNVYVNTTLKLFTIDLATGVCTLVGSFTHAAPAVIDIAISPTGQMYGTDITSDSLYSIDKTTGATTLIGPLGVNIAFAQGMDFDNSDGTLYQFAYIGAGVNHLRTINTTTGASTLVLNGPVGPEHEGSVKVALTPPAPPDIFVDEVEPNNTSATAQAIPSTPFRIRGNLYNAPFAAATIDVDVYSFTAAAGDRVFATTATQWSSGSQDTELDILGTDGTTVLETDDDNGTLGGTSSVIAGRLLPAAGTYYVRVRQGVLTALSSTVRPYDLYVRVHSGAAPPEVEPNDAVPQPLPASGWVSGVVNPAADSDVFSVAAEAGDTIVAMLDLDPERDAITWNGRLGIGNFNNFFLIATDAGTADAQPAEAMFITVKTAGTYFIYVQEQVAGQGSPTATYTVSASVIPAKTRTCTTYTGTGGAIADLGTTDFTINVPDNRVIDYMRLSVTATHPATADLDVTLISPDNGEVIMFDDPGTQAGAGAPQINTVLEDEAAFPMSIFTIHSGMGYAPEVGGRFAHFKGMPSQGTWTLRVRDDLTANAGTLDSWSIDVCEPAPRPACILPGPQETTVYSSDFEANDGGFTHSGTLDEWERGLPAFPPITTAHSGTNAWMTDLDGNYELSANMNLVSPPLDLTAATGRITASWWQKYHIESASFDSYWVEARQVGNPASARRLFSWTGSTMNRSVGNPSVSVPMAAGWGRVIADVSAFAGSTIELVYHLDTDTSVVLNGIAVDDVLVTSCTQVVGQALANVGITKTNNQATYFPGQQVTYTIVANNAGPSAVVDAVVTDNFPAELTNVTWTCTASAGSSCTASGSGDINDTVDLLSGGSATYTATATVSASATGPIANTATIANPPNTADPNPANNTATDTDTFLASAPTALVVDSAGNGVYQPNETVVVAPTWRNLGATAAAFTGTLGSHTGPAGPSYNVPDANADYGTIPGGAAQSCTTTGNCYSVSNTTATRPAVHWDSTAVETISPSSSAPKTWTLHIGNSFIDVVPTSPFLRFIETLLHRGVTGGCSATEYCPSSSTTREQMAVFVLVAKEGTGFVPPPCAPPNMFGDVPETSPFCRWIEELATRGVVAGCGGGNYCPTDAVTREQMSVFVLRTLDPTLNPPACVPPNIYGDVPETSVFCRWIEELTNRGVVTGCGGGNYCPVNPVTREQMGVFLTVTFGLTLYGL